MIFSEIASQLTRHNTIIVIRFFVYFIVLALVDQLNERFWVHSNVTFVVKQCFDDQVKWTTDCVVKNRCQ